MSNLFPTVDPWPFTYNPEWGQSGYCNPDQKHIYFGVDSPALVIHELCHAVAPTGHGTKWQRRVLIAAETARQSDHKLYDDLVSVVER